jgi:nucleotide-binding universal stress UspA family protein
MSQRLLSTTDSPSRCSTVLVGLDGSHLAAAALPRAVEVARNFGANIVLLHVMPRAGDDPSDPPREHQARRSQLEAYLAGLKRSLDRGDVHVDWRLEEGPIAPTIARIASELAFTVIVMSRVGRTASLEHEEKPHSGSVAEQLALEWQGPLMLVEPYD